MNGWLIGGTLAAVLVGAATPADAQNRGAAGAPAVPERQETAVVSGDVLLIEKVERSRGRTLPRHGMAMDTVLDRFGEPVSRTPAVGEPPITRWRYETFTVYFEHDRVLHAVVRMDALGLGRSS